MSSLQRALERFSSDLRGFTNRVSDSVNTLKRGADSRPHAGVDAFRENLEDLEQQVADIASEVQRLERCTTDAISLEELLGHCVELYQSNRQGALALVSHLERYGYQQPPGAAREPEDPCSTAAAVAGDIDEFVLEDDDADDMLAEGPGARLQQPADDQPGYPDTAPRHGAASTASSPGARRPQHGQVPPPSRSMPSSPASSHPFGGQYVPSRLGIGQPGSPARNSSSAAAAAAAAAAFALGGPATGGVGVATAAKLAPPHTRPSYGGASSVSLTPEGLAMLSPGLADKYACQSSSGTTGGLPSVGGAIFMDSGGSVPCTTARRPAARDLRLDYGRCSSDSPSMPIFGKTPRSTSLPASTVSGLPDAPPTGGPLSGAGSVPAPGKVAAAAGHGAGGGPLGCSPLSDPTNTGDLYDFIIRSNMGLPLAETTPTPTPTKHTTGRRDHADVEDGQLLLARPTTPGRSLPAGWHESALQELDSLSLTLSQLKRSPSRPRVVAAAAALAAVQGAGSGCSGDGDCTGGTGGGDTLALDYDTAEVEAAALGGGRGAGDAVAGAQGSWGGRAGDDDTGDADAGRRRDQFDGGDALDGPESGGGSGSADENMGAAFDERGQSPAKGVLRNRQEAAASPPAAGAGAQDEGAAGKMRPSPVRPAASAQRAPLTPTTRAALRRQLAMHDQQQAGQAAGAAGGGAGAAATETPHAVDADEFSSLPAWCNRQLTLGELNRALEGLGKAAAAAPRQQQRGCGEDPDSSAVGLETLQALGFDSGKGRAIFNCLTKLGRAQLQRAAGGGVAYRLVAPGRQ